MGNDNGNNLMPIEATQSLDSSTEHHHQPQQDPPPAAPLLATPSQYESVIEDLRMRGLEELASEILRLTATSEDDGDEDEGLGRATLSTLAPIEKDGKLRVKAAPTTVLRVSGGKNPNPKSAGLPPTSANATTTTKEQLAAMESDLVSAMLGGATSSPLKTAVPSPPIGLASADKQRSSSHSVRTCATTSNASSRELSVAAQDDSVEASTTTVLGSTESAVASPTQLTRNSGHNGIISSHPGAYSVMPSGSEHQYQQHVDDSTEDVTVSSENNHNGAGDIEQGQTSAISASRDPSSLLIALPPPQQDDDDAAAAQDEQESGALEAVRVDDIMTVKAEPLSNDGRSKLYKTIACVACAVVALVLILTIALSVNNSQQAQNDASLTESAPAEPTYYNAETRFHLMRELLIQRFEPYYNVNYNTTTGRAILQETFQTTMSPQYRALDWLARHDPVMEAVTRPALDNFEVLHATDTIAIHGDVLLGGGGRRQLSSTETEPAVHNRIVQRYALAVLFYSTGNWTNSFEFLSNEPECDWNGALQCGTSSATDDKIVNDPSAHEDTSDGSDSSNVTDTTTAHNDITHLDLRNNNLHGTLPVELAALTALESLNLANNDLSGTLPPALASLSQLQQLDLGFNKFTGTIPDTYYQSWGQLESWILSESQLSGTISTHIGNLVSIKELLWQRNNLGGTIPPQFWYNLTNMEQLDLSQQKVKFVNESIGTEIGLWSNLRSFIVHGLELRGTVPSEIGQLTNLARLQIASNHLSGTIPSELGMLTAVTRLSLSLNAITGTVPTAFLHLTSLTRLYLQNTLLSGDVSFLCQGIEDGILLPMDPLRVDMGEVSGCSCCTCCLY